MTDCKNPSLYEFKLFDQLRDQVSIAYPSVRPQTSNMNESMDILDGMPVTVTGKVEGKAASVDIKVMDSDRKEGTFQGKVEQDGTFKAVITGKFKPGTVTFTAYAKDQDGQFIAISDSQDAILREGKDLAKGMNSTTSTNFTNFGGDKALDGMTGTRWAPKDSDQSPTLTLDLDGSKEFNRIIIRENTKGLPLSEVQSGILRRRNMETAS